MIYETAPGAEKGLEPQTGFQAFFRGDYWPQGLRRAACLPGEGWGAGKRTARKVKVPSSQEQRSRPPHCSTLLRFQLLRLC